MATPDRPKAPVAQKPPPLPSGAARPVRRPGQVPAAPPRQAVSRPPSPPPTTVQSAAFAAAKEALLEKRPYLKWAFANPYNLSLLAGGLVASILTLNPLPAILAIGLEGVWLLHAPESKRLRHLLWDPKYEKLKRALLEQERAERLQGLGEAERARVLELFARQDDILRLAARNPSFAGDLLRGELTKTDRLVDAFIDMAATSERYAWYLESVDIAAIDADRERLEREIAAGGDGGPQVELAKKNLAIILRRQEKMKEIRRYLDVARGQLDLIENSFKLIADQIVTMQSPQELSGQLNELLDGVESIRQTAVDTDVLLSNLGVSA